MTNRQKATGALAIIMNALNMPNGSTLGDIALALSIIDPDDSIMSLIKPLLRNSIIDEIKHSI